MKGVANKIWGTDTPEVFAEWVSKMTGSTLGFVGALLIIVCWAVTGPAFGFSDTWQLVINTGTTIVTFLMVFLIQRSQNKELLAIQIKLNELIKGCANARDEVIAIEKQTEARLHAEYLKQGPTH